MTTTDQATRRPAKDEYFEYYANYINQVPEGNIFEILESQNRELEDFFARVSDRDASVVHPPYSWTTKQVVGHLIDAERIFANRLHRFACGDLQDENGMEQDPYVAYNDYETPTIRSLVDELVHCRKANSLLLRRIKASAWDNRANASGHPITVRALAYILVGHINHHMKILRQRLGLG